jgi:hypothetical protein
MKLRPSDGAMLADIPLNTGPYLVAFDGSNLWVTNGSKRSRRSSLSALVNLLTGISFLALKTQP